MLNWLLEIELFLHLTVSANNWWPSQLELQNTQIEFLQRGRIPPEERPVYDVKEWSGFSNAEALGNAE